MGSNNRSRPTVLVIHALRPTSRQTTIDHLLSFREHLPDCDVRYLHFQQSVPADAGDVAPDLLVVNYDYLNYRFTPLWPFIRRRHRDLARRAGAVVAIVNDDFWANELLDDWCIDWDVDRILTPIDKDREVLYPRSIRTKEFRTGLTGYVRSGPIPSTPLLEDRTIDLGQRVRDMPPHLGRLAQAKARQATTMADAARAAGFVVDVSTRVEDSFIGPAWFEFLADCRFTVGMKGGASLHDPIGLIHTRVEAYSARHPTATFDQIERHCFRGKDGRYEFTAISPRLFEAALAGTCQVLQEDDYLGVMEPWRDYLPLAADFSNMSEIIGAMRDLDRCQEIVTNARRTLVESGVFDYSRLVFQVTDGLLRANVQTDVGWSRLCAHLENSSVVADTLGTDLHDAVLHLIAEADVSDLIGPASGRRSRARRRGAEQHIVTILREHGLWEWFEEQVVSTRGDRLVMRAPWIWRPVPRLGWGGHDT